MAVAAILYFWIELGGSTQFDGVKITGTLTFRQHVVASLLLLKNKAPEAYEIVTNYIGVIAESAHTGMAAYESPPTSYMRDQSEGETTTSFASDMAHESFHSKLYHDYLKQDFGEKPGIVPYMVPDAVWGGEAGEKKCCEHQLLVLKQIGAPSSEIYDHYWNPSNRYWEIPYEKQWW